MCIFYTYYIDDFIRNLNFSDAKPISNAAEDMLNPLVPAQVKFARFRSVQKCTFFAFYAKFERAPLKIFIS